jgi:H+/Cl- antiporter ClcA
MRHERAVIDHDHLQHLLSPRQWLLRLVFWGGALSVGIVAVVFALGAELAQWCFRQILAVSPWLPFLVTPAGLALSTWLSRNVFEGSQGSGIPQTIAALQLEDQEKLGKLLSLRIAAGKVLLTFLALGCGASIGREGPTVQIGASIMYSLRRFSRFTHKEELRALIVAGGAAGVAAAFNTPLAGIVFAIEELSRTFEQRTSGLVLTAVIFAGLAAHGMLGNYAYFGKVSTSLGEESGWIAIVACGLVGGLSGGLFSRLLVIFANRGWRGRSGAWIRHNPIGFAALCGFALAALGVLSGHHSYGTGYEEVRDILAHGDADYPAYALYKFLATLVSYLSGIPGGLFAPSLAIGAGLGSSLAHLMPYVPLGTMIVLGMAAYFAGVTQAPLTTFVIVMEMTDNHSIVLPLMATALIAHGISRVVCHEPLYKALAEIFLTRLAAKDKPPVP